jgi:hypothetical protein
MGLCHEGKETLVKLYPRILGGRRVLVVPLVGAAAAAAVMAASVGASPGATAAAPANEDEPVVSGAVVVGSTLSATSGTWTGTVSTFAYQWVRCAEDGGLPDGSNCVFVSGATSPTYVLVDADVGKRMRIRVTAANSDGSTTVASNATDIVKAASTAVAPSNTAAPTVTGRPVQSTYLRASTGTWSGTQPLEFAFRWLSCDTAGNNCKEIAAASDNDYYVRDTDVGLTLRARVTASNDAGSAPVTTAATAVVTAKPAAPPVGIIPLPGGERSIPVTSVTGSERLIVDQVRFSPGVVSSRTQPITVRVRVKDTRGYVVRDATVFIRSTPKVTSGGDGQKTGQDGWLSYTLTPERDFPQIRNGYAQQFFVRAYLPGTNPLAGINGYRLVQVPFAP